MANLYFGSTLSFMRNQKYYIYKRCIVTDHPQKEASDIYKCFDIYCSESIKIENEKLKYTPPSIDIQLFYLRKAIWTLTEEIQKRVMILR